jgi:hypothetical protein
MGAWGRGPGASSPTDKEIPWTWTLPGTLNLVGNNSFGRRTRINGVTLEVGGSLRLSETDVNNGGTLAPGSNPSTIRIGNLDLISGGRRRSGELDEAIRVYNASYLQ